MILSASNLRKQPSNTNFDNEKSVALPRGVVVFALIASRAVEQASLYLGLLGVGLYLLSCFTVIIIIVGNNVNLSVVDWASIPISGLFRIKYNSNISTL